MKIKINRQTFVEAIADAASITSQKHAIQILKNARITTKGNRMKIESNDTEIAVVKYIDLIECDEDASFLVEAADLNKYIGKLTDVVLEIDVNNESLKIKHSKGEASFSILDAKEYPTFKTDEDDSVEVSIPADKLARIVKNAKNFIATDTLRPIMCGIYVGVKDTTVEYCGTDTAVMAYGELSIAPQSNVETNFIITSKVIPLLTKLCQMGDDIQIISAKSRITLRCNNVLIHSLQPKGTFPPYKRIVQQQSNMTVCIDAKPLLESINRIVLFTDTSKCVKMKISQMDILASARDLTAMKQSSENIAHDGCNGELTIGVNADYMIKCTSAFMGMSVNLKFSDSSHPIIFSPKDDSKDLHILLMPMALPS